MHMVAVFGMCCFTTCAMFVFVRDRRWVSAIIALPLSALTLTAVLKPIANATQTGAICGTIMILGYLIYTALRVNMPKP